MWTMIPSLAEVGQPLGAVFTDASFRTHCQFLLAWVMCLGDHNIYRVATTANLDRDLPRSQRHCFDRFYNFFCRSAWVPAALAREFVLLAVTRLVPFGTLTLVVDDTLLHKRGQHVWGIGWFRDAVASTRKRTATASGHNWVVLALSVPVPLCPTLSFCIPLNSRLHRPGKGRPGCASLAREMLVEVLGWLPGRNITLLADGAYSAKELLLDLPGRVDFIGRVRSDAALYEVKPRRQPRSKRGRKPSKGPRLPSPKQAAAKADRSRSSKSPWQWQDVEVTIYGEKCRLKAFSYQAVWPRVFGLAAVMVVVVRDPEGRMEDAYLFSTKEMPLALLIEKFSERWGIEVLFRASKQQMHIEDPQHWCAESVQKVAPWVWLVQGLVMLWYLLEGHKTQEAKEEQELMGPWDSEWSLRHMLRVLRRATWNATFDINSASADELHNWLLSLRRAWILAA
jgi:hypothetical protein